MTYSVNASSVRLCDETTLSPLEAEKRLELGRILANELPHEVLERLSVWQPAVGCLNRCSFCSQESGICLRFMDGPSVRTLAGAFRYVQEKTGIPFVSCGRQYKPGIIFPYLDNDIASYPYLIDYLVSSWSLGMRVRISTIGWSRENEKLNEMHRIIVQKYSHMLAGVRFSLNAYSVGWRTNREAFLEDFINAMRIYRPLLRLNDPQGHSGGCIDISFIPDVIACTMETVLIDGYHVICGSGYNVVSINAQGESWLVTGAGTSEQAVEAVRQHPKRLDDLTVVHGLIKLLHNEDGDYYGFYPDNSCHVTDGLFLLPATAKRRGGVFAACWPLRELADFIHADDADISTFKDLEYQTSLFTNASCHTEHRRDYLHRALIPMVSALCRILSALELPPHTIFDRMVVRDRGMIRNSGRAYYEFKAIASGANIMVVPEPVLSGGSTEEVWRVFPATQTTVPKTRAAQGVKSMMPFDDTVDSDSLCLIAWAVDAPSHTHIRRDGSVRDGYCIPIHDYIAPLAVYDLKQGKAAGLMPGVTDLT